MSKSHAIYGDEDQEYLFELFEEQDEIQRLVDASNRQLMKERFKKVKKKNTIGDTTVNMVKPRDIPEDVKEGKPDKKDKAKKEELAKEKKEKPKKKLNEKGITRLLLVFFLIILFLIGYQFKDEIKELFSSIDTKEIVNVFNSLTNKEKQKDDETIKIENNGYLGEAESKDYSIKEILDVAAEANEALRNYYDALVKIASENSKDKVASITSANIEMIDKDLQKFEGYEHAFNQYTGGTTYYSSLHNRFLSLNDLLSTLEFVESSKVYDYINSAIETENQKVIEDKANLINFLQLNNVPYTDNGNEVIFDVE